MYLWLCITSSTAFMVLDAGTAPSALPMASMFFNTANTSASGSCFISSLFLLKASADTYQSLIAFLPHQLYFLKPSFSASSLKHWRQYTSPYFLITPPVLPHFLHLCTFFPDFLFFGALNFWNLASFTGLPSICLFTLSYVIIITDGLKVSADTFFLKQSLSLNSSLPTL